MLTKIHVFACFSTLEHKITTVFVKKHTLEMDTKQKWQRLNIALQVEEFGYKFSLVSALMIWFELKIMIKEKNTIFKILF